MKLFDSNLLLITFVNNLNFTMINNSEFSKRLKIVMEYYQLSASTFADKIGVQRSSISHLLSGRNKPSLDFVLKVIKEFKNVELYWLLNGKGKFPNITPVSDSSIKIKENNAMETPEVSALSNKNEKIIERIVLFYTDGTFKEYLK